MTNSDDRTARREPGPIERACVACLDSFGYKHHTGPRNPDLRFFFQTQSRATWWGQLSVYETEQVLRFYAHADDMYSPSRIGWVGDLVHRVNFEVAVLGSFVIELNRGGVSYRTGVDCRGQEIGPKLVERMMNAVAFPLSIWEAAFKRIDSPKVDPLSALYAALIECDASDAEFVSKRTRRALLNIMHGGRENAGAGQPTTAEKIDLKLL